MVGWQVNDAIWVARLAGQWEGDIILGAGGASAIGTLWSSEQAKMSRLAWVFALKLESTVPFFKKTAFPYVFNFAVSAVTARSSTSVMRSHSARVMTSGGQKVMVLL